MGILYMNTADVGDTTLFASAGVGCTVSTAQARTGSKSFRQATTASGGAVIGIPPTNEGYLRVCVYITSPDCDIRLRDATGIIHLNIGLDPTLNSLVVYRGSSVGGTVIASASLEVPTAVWIAVEARWKIADSGGIIQVKINGNMLINETSVDTKNAGIDQITSILLQPQNTTSEMYTDDIIVRDDQWPMRGGIHVLVPNADGDTVSWTKSDALKGYHEHINTQPPDYTDYLEADATVAATKQLTHLTTLADDVWNIRGVGAHVNCKSTVSTDAFVRTLLLPADIGASQAVGSDFGVESAVSWTRTYYEQNPHDSAAWEKADIDDLQIGVETRVPA